MERIATVLDLKRCIDSAHYYKQTITWLQWYEAHMEILRLIREKHRY